MTRSRRQCAFCMFVLAALVVCRMPLLLEPLHGSGSTSAYGNSLPFFVPLPSCIVRPLRTFHRVARQSGRWTPLPRACWRRTTWRCPLPRLQ